MIGEIVGAAGGSERATTCSSPQYNKQPQNPPRTTRTVFYSATNSRMFSAQTNSSASRANNNTNNASDVAHSSRMFVRIRLQT
ncbi:unnamed protein product [Orchesella dallaii]|uniref:Uncharacterized protein n=1 Tax=Orchesella dallaii TaxID=48710 RepID=A0ABP1QQK6_9HEXA